MGHYSSEAVPPRPLLRICAVVLTILIPTASSLTAQSPAGVVLDQTGLPLPGATVQLLDDSRVVATVATASDGTFVLDTTLPGRMIVVSLDGFETARVPRHERTTIVLSLAHATDATTVVAPTIAPASPTTTVLGSTLTATTVGRLPSTRLKARESLPLLPSVVRGPDGLMRLGGARAYETPLLLDGFNVTDPATGMSTLNLPFEAVRGVDVLRDPMAITYGRLLGGLVQLESKTGGDHFSFGVQGVIPRPRFSNPGFGRVEGIFPRTHIGGTTSSGRIQYLAAAEYDFERIAVPEVTLGPGPDVIEQSTTVFGRLDVQVTPRNHVTLEGFAFPSSTQAQGLSPRRERAATADVRGLDLFAGITNRFVPNGNSVLTIQVGALMHDAELGPAGTDAARLSPSGWSGNWFAAVSRRAWRYTATVTWERAAVMAGRSHDLSMAGSVATRRLRGTVHEAPLTVYDGGDRVARTIDFGPQSTISAHDWPQSVSVRDVWHLSNRVQLDAGVRYDHAGTDTGGSPSSRVGIRYAIDDAAVTVVKVGYGSFVGNLPLLVEAFEGYPHRIDRTFNPATGLVVSENHLVPQVDALRLPRAVAATVAIERQLRPRLDAQIGATSRHSTRLATLRVPVASGPLTIDSTGESTYRELQITIRRTFDHGQQVLISYVRSSARGELNDFNTLFQGFDAPLLQPGGQARLMADAPHRLIAWGTFDLPGRVVVSPVVEWRSGFPYSALNYSYRYAEAPNGRSFPSFMTLDLIVYKTFTVRRRSADLGIQLFNATNRYNPRDVFPVLGAAHAGEFTNALGPILRGYMMLKW